MLVYLRKVALAALLAVAAGQMTEAQVMETPLKAPAEVPLDFLVWIDKDSEWLSGAMAELDVSSGYTLSETTAEAGTVEALKALNRIRAFAHLAARGLRPPYFDLTVAADGGDRFRCVTLFPKSIVPSLGPLDFAVESFPSSGAEPTILDLCRVGPSKGADYAGLDAETFRTRYFDAAGDLRVDFVRLNTDAGFIAAAMDHGFFVMQGDVTGRLKLAQQ